MSTFDEHVIVQWVRADTEKSGAGYYYQLDSLGRKFGTKSVLVASLAHEYHRKKLWCRPISFRGFDFRELVGMEQAADPTVPVRVSPDAHLGGTEL